MDPEDQAALADQALEPTYGGSRVYRVYDAEAGGVRELAAGPELEAGLRSGRFGVSSQAGPVALVGPDGERYEVDPADIGGALADGRFVLETPDDAARANAARIVAQNPGLSAAQAGLASFADEITFGAASRAAGAETRMFLDAAQTDSPIATTIGTILGAAAPAFLTGGASSAGAVARLTPGGLAAAAGTAAERALAARLGEGLAARALSTVGGAVADGALSGAAAAITQAGIDGTPIEAERILSDVLFGAALGLGGGAAVAGAGAALRGARRLASQATRATEYAERLASRGLGDVVAPTTVQRVAAWASGVDPEDLARIAVDPRRAFDADGFARAARETADSMGALRAQLDSAGAALADAGRRRAALTQAAAGVDGALASATTRTALEAAQGRLREAVTTIAGDGRTAAGRVLRGLDDDVSTALAGLADGDAADAIVRLDGVIAALDDAAPRVTDASGPVLAEVRATLAQVASDAATFGTAGARFGELDGVRRGLIETAPAFAGDARALSDAAMSAGGGEELARAVETAQELLARAEAAGADVAPARQALETARARIGDTLSWGAARGSAERGLAAEGGEGARSVLLRELGGRVATGVVGGAAGAVLGGQEGAYAGAAAGSLLGLATRPVSAYQRIARLGGSARRYTQRLEAGVERVARVLSSGRLERAASGAARTASRVVLALRGSPEERRAEYRAVSDEIRALAADPDALGARLGSSIVPVGEASPELSDAMAATAVRGVQYLASRLPATDAPSLLPTTRQPSQWEVDAFLRRYEAIEDPLSILDRAAEGSLRLEHREAVEAVYPEVYADVRGRMTEMLGALEEAPPYAVRLQLGVLMGVPADPSLQPSMIAALQSQYSQTTAQFETINLRPVPLDSSASDATLPRSDQIASRL